MEMIPSVELPVLDMPFQETQEYSVPMLNLPEMGGAAAMPEPGAGYMMHPAMDIGSPGSMQLEIGAAGMLQVRNDGAVRANNPYNAEIFVHKPWRAKCFFYLKSS